MIGTAFTNLANVPFLLLRIGHLMSTLTDMSVVAPAFEPILGLFFASSPTNISRRVVSIIVDAFYCEFRSWRISDIFIEGFKRWKQKFNAPIEVISFFRRSVPFQAFFNVVPSPIDLCPGLSMSRVRLCANLAMQTPAALRTPTQEHLFPHNRLFSASALAQPADCAIRRIFSSGDNDEATKTLTGQITHRRYQGI